MSSSECSFGWESVEEDDKPKDKIKVKKEKLSSQESNSSAKNNKKRKILSDDSDESSFDESNLTKTIKEEPSSAKKKKKAELLKNIKKSSDSDDSESSSDNLSKKDEPAAPKNDENKMSSDDSDSNESLSDFKRPSWSRKSIHNNKKNEQSTQRIKNIVSSINQNGDLRNDDDDEEIWAVQCPNDIKVSSIEKMDFFGSKTDIKLGGNNYEFQIQKYPNSKKLNLGFPNQNALILKTFAFNGVIHLREKTHLPNDIELLAMARKNVKFPENLKTRHPLLGYDYKNVSKLSKSIRDKLNDINNCVKLKSSKSRNEELVESPIASKRKRKHDDSYTESPKSRKKQKIEPQDWNNETSIEQSLFSDLKETTKKIKKEKK